jgi:hypothetical protein
MVMKKDFVELRAAEFKRGAASRDAEVANLAALGSNYLNRANAAELELDKAFEAGRAAEREDCAKLCDERYEELLEMEIFEMAQAIRARGMK